MGEKHGPNCHTLKHSFTWLLLRENLDSGVWRNDVGLFGKISHLAELISFIEREDGAIVETAQV